MERAELLTLMDLNWMEMVREIARFTPGGWVVESEGLVMCGSPRGTMVANMAIVAGRVAAATVRAQTERCFRGTGVPFSVMTRDHADAALQGELSQKGFREVDLLTTPAMAFFAGAGAPPPLPQGIAIRSVVGDAGREDYARVMAEAYGVYGAPKASILSHFALLASVIGP